MTYKLDAEEKEILKLFEQNKLKRVKNLKREITEAKKSASEHMKKNSRITIRISEFDLAGLKRKAAAEGIPYQTLISSILHKYLRA